MSKNTDSEFDFSAFDADPELSKERSISVPPPTEQINIERRPFGFTPMGEVETDRQAYRGLTQGRMRWWIIITSWFVVALPPLVIGGHIIFTSLWHLLTVSKEPIGICIALILMGVTLVFSSLPLLIVIRATKAKLKHEPSGKRSYRASKLRRWVTDPRRSSR